MKNLCSIQKPSVCVYLGIVFSNLKSDVINYQIILIILMLTTILLTYYTYCTEIYRLQFVENVSALFFENIGK